MADRSAAMLAELLCSDGARPRTDALSQALAEDPPLAIWAVCVARPHKQTPPTTLEQLAHWLAKDLPSLLVWEEPPCRSTELLDPGIGDLCAAQVASDLQLAVLASHLSGSDADSFRSEAYLAGLLRCSRRWLALTGMGVSDVTAEAFLRWPEAACGQPANHWVCQALEILEGKRSLPPGAMELRAFQQRAAEGRRRWTETVPSPHLPLLARKLRRLRQLEQESQQAVETEKLEAMAEFAAGAGHEINNPLTVIGGRAQLLLRDEQDVERRRDLALIGAQVKRAHEMIADMRLFARPPRPERQTVELVALADRVLAELAEEATQRAVTLARSGEEAPLSILADPVQISVALRALCTNALEAIGQGGAVDVRLQRSGQEAVIRVSDNGPGIPPEHRRHLFDPFYSARQAGRGLGLGLSKCWRIVTLHGGSVKVESEPGQGTVFVIRLPQDGQGEGGG